MALCRGVLRLNLLSPRHLYSSTCFGIRCFSDMSKPLTASESTVDHLIYTHEHFALRDSLGKIIAQEINPHVDQWEAEGKFPAHKVFKILGNAGFLGVNKPV
ncbi:hypothetical protein LDENG_00039400, partial [Lucifuga dentata]